MQKPTLLSAFLVSIDHQPVKGVKRCFRWTIEDCWVMIAVIDYRLDRLHTSLDHSPDMEVSLHALRAEIIQILSSLESQAAPGSAEDDEIPF